MAVVVHFSYAIPNYRDCSAVMQALGLDNSLGRHEIFPRLPPKKRNFECARIHKMWQNAQRPGMFSFYITKIARVVGEGNIRTAPGISQLLKN